MGKQKPRPGLDAALPNSCSSLLLREREGQIGHRDPESVLPGPKGLPSQPSPESLQDKG